MTVVVLYCYLVLLFRFSFLFLRVCSRSCVRSPDCSILQRLIRYIPFSRCHFVCDYFFFFFTPSSLLCFFLFGRSFWSELASQAESIICFYLLYLLHRNAYLYVARCVVLYVIIFLDIHWNRPSLRLYLQNLGVKNSVNSSISLSEGWMTGLEMTQKKWRALQRNIARFHNSERAQH